MQTDMHMYWLETVHVAKRMYKMQSRCAHSPALCWPGNGHNSFLLHGQTMCMFSMRWMQTMESSRAHQLLNWHYLQHSCAEHFTISVSPPWQRPCELARCPSHFTDGDWGWETVVCLRSFPPKITPLVWWQFSLRAPKLFGSLDTHNPLYKLPYNLSQFDTWYLNESCLGKNERSLY